MRKSADDQPSMVLPSDVIFSLVRELLGGRKRVTFNPKGESMLPFIKGDRDSVVLEAPGKELERGDIVLVNINGQYIMHRIIRIDGENLTLMGDGNLKRKEFCTKSGVIGVVCEIVNERGKRTRAGKARLWRFLLPLRRFVLAVYKRTLYRLR